MTTVWIYVDTRHHVGHPGHLKVFANVDAAETWLQENDPEGPKVWHSNMRLWSERDRAPTVEARADAIPMNQNQ
jgi:hypothetical protein